MTVRTRAYRALVVDDDENLRDLVRLTFDREGLRCDVAEDGVVAENHLRQRQYDVVVCDLRMPRKHGHQLVSEILSKPSHPMVIVVTGVVEPRLVADLFGRGVTDVISKPLDYRVLAVKIKALLDRRQAVNAQVGAADGFHVVGQIDVASSALQEQLSQITDSFNATIDNLTSQKDEIEARFLSTVRLFTGLMEEGGHSTESHAGRVEQMAVALGKVLNLTNSELHTLSTAALLHDIGQFGMPDSVRTKPPWHLSPDERGVYRRYPQIGAALISEMPGAAKIAEIIEQHAENYDGTGFPWALTAEETSILSRIVRIADGTDTFMSHARGVDLLQQVQDHLRTQRGKAYDPELTPHATKYLTEYLRANEERKPIQLRSDALRPGLVLAENLYDEDGHYLARKGALLTPPMISLLRKLINNQSVAVYEPSSTE